VNEPVRPDDYRVSDVERAAVQERLRDAVGAGQLDLHEFDERVATAWAAKTRGELAQVTADLPEPPPAPPPPPPAPPRRVFSDDSGGTALRVLSIIWACAFSINLVVWTLVSLTNVEFIYPWPVWLLPPAALLATLYAIGIGRPKQP
jgi:Domain of unknown function (DUF1707)